MFSPNMISTWLSCSYLVPTGTGRYVPQLRVDGLNHMSYQMIYASGAAGTTLFYGYYAARPRWGRRRAAIFGGAAFALGTMYGGFRRFVAHRQFSEALENPEGFMTTLSHVHKRLGGDGNIGFTLQHIPRKPSDTDVDNSHTMQRPEVSFESQKHSDAAGESVLRVGNCYSMNACRVTGSGAENQSSTPKNRWDEIRAANARGVGQYSTWDAIRQRHERHKISSPSSATNGVANDEEEDRMAARARFEAMIEAERRIGRDQDRRTSI